MDVNYGMTQEQRRPTRCIYSARRDVQTKPIQESIASAEDYAACRQIMQAASKNYSSASSYLPAEKQPHVEALYALMRVGDDRVDVSYNGYESPQEAIDNWEHEYITGIRDGRLPASRASRLPGHRKRNSPSRPDIMTPYFRAMREDLTITRFPTFDDLMHYMDGSAIPVGRAMTHISGS